MVLPQYDVGSSFRRRKGAKPSKDTILCISIGINIILVLSIMYLVTFPATSLDGNRSVKGIDMVWHGGHPADTHPGSCWCGDQDKYCMCTPNIAVDVVIVSGENKEFLWLVIRKDTNQLATMGGFVEVDESVENAVKRELNEEMGIDVNEPPVLFGIYSDPRRDNRRRTVSAVYVIHLDSHEMPHAGDDAKTVKKISIDDIEQHEYFADHKSILLDYRRFVRGEKQELRTESDFAPDIIRSTCAVY